MFILLNDLTLYTHFFVNWFMSFYCKCFANDVRRIYYEDWKNYVYRFIAYYIRRRPISTEFYSSCKNNYEALISSICSYISSTSGSDRYVTSMCFWCNSKFIYERDFCSLILEQLKELEHLNTSFKHFMLFVHEFDLIEQEQLAPLKEFIEVLAPNRELRGSF